MYDFPLRAEGAHYQAPPRWGLALLHEGISCVPQIPVISIIDDDPSVRAATHRLVRSLGFSARTFASAADFLQSPHVNDTACVIADVQMPGMSGVELQSCLIAQGSFVPMIFITAYPEDSIRSRAMKAGAICFLSRPFDGLRMIECIRTALKRHDDDDGNCRT
jgi:FixJ family two-component response regulator